MSLQDLRFAIHKLGRLIHVRWDIIHRAVNDVKGALADSGSLFLSGQMHSTYLWALQYRPFGSGGFMEEKKRMMDHFIAVQSADYGPFVEQLQLFKLDLGLPEHTLPQDVFDAICELPGFTKKGTLPKLSRWFSWNQSCEEQVPEFRVLRMVLKHWLGSAAEKLDPNDAVENRELKMAVKDSLKSPGTKESLRSEFSRLKANLGGGLKLAYYLMSDRLLQTVRLIAAATRPTWCWYSNTIKSVKTASDNVRQSAELQKRWSSDDHLIQTAEILTGRSPEVVSLFQDPELSRFKSDSAEKLFKLVCNLLKRRAWSFAKQYAAPPDCYAGILGGSVLEAQASHVSVTVMR